MCNPSQKLCLTVFGDASGLRYLMVRGSATPICTQGKGLFFVPGIDIGLVYSPGMTALMKAKLGCARGGGGQLRRDAEQERRAHGLELRWGSSVAFGLKELGFRGIRLGVMMAAYFERSGVSGGSLSVWGRLWMSSMAGAKFVLPDVGPKNSARGADLGDAPFSRLRIRPVVLAPSAVMAITSFQADGPKAGSS